MKEGQERPKINQAMRIDVENSVLCWLATVDPSGTPNVTPKEIFSCYGDDRIVVADIASTHTVRNIRSHPSVCVSFVDVFRQRGFKVVGLATVIEPEETDFAVVGADFYGRRHISACRQLYEVFPDKRKICLSHGFDDLVLAAEIMV
jgi:predicted pyridoxine 5'-phosphate oxidase superfamily flavin-nucleotide-binding protein